MRLTPSQQEALNINKHVCVTAGAGSGKTTVLVERYLKILREGNATPREIVAITFTDKAAAEMKDRVIERLSAQPGNEDSEESNSLQHFRDEMNSAHISTIHAFCSSILKEFPFQADVPANFSITSGIDQKLLLQRTLKKTLKDIATNLGDPHREELTRLLQRYGGQQKLVDFFSTMINQRDVVAQLMREIYDNRSETEIRENLQQQILEQLMPSIDVPEFIRCLNVVLQVATGKRKKIVSSLTQQLEPLSAQSPNSLEMLNLLKEIAYLIVTEKNSIAKRDFIGLKVEIISIETEVNFLVSAAKKIKDTPSLGTDDNFLLRTTRDLLTLYTRILNDYETAKLSQGALDFNDLQLKTRDLLCNNKDIQKALIKRHKYYMVDEYQDTNELQHELVMLLTNELKDANLFIVGDPKQSIYGFRGADVRVFEKIKQKIIDIGGEDISLTENFRSLRDAVGFVNYFFYTLMKDGTQTEFEVTYEALTQARPVNSNGGIEILVGKQGEEAVNEYALIAQHIQNMKTNREIVWVRGDNGAELERPIAYGDIAILIRSRTHLPDLEHALLEANIPYLTTGGVGFYQRQEIYDIWNYLNFLNEPVKNQISLAAVLRSPAFGISDTELYEISLQAEESLWNKAQQYQRPTNHLSTAIDILRKHCELAHRMPVNRLIGTIVKETGLIGTLKIGQQAEQRWANYQKLLELARNFDGDENKQALPDFIEFLNILITEEPLEGQAPIEASTGAVRIMTIHAAKGLQFPIVIIPGLDRGGQTDREPFIDEVFGIGFSPLNPDEGYKKTGPEIITHMKNRSSEKDTAEKKRLFYVAATRAQDRLILSGTLSDKDQPQQMLEWLHTYLEISKENDLLNLDIEQDVFVDDRTNRQRFQLQIPISRVPADIAPAAEVPDETTPVEFPEDLPSMPEPNGTSSSFTVAELANYARCPLRYQLENVLQIPTDAQDAAGLDKTEFADAIRRLLARIRRPSDVQNLDTIINQTAENYLEETSKLTTALHTSANNFINSQLGETALSASEIRTNQQVHADIEGHIIDGRFDRLFKDETGCWQGINYETGNGQASDADHPEMELYSLLLHRRYPEQPTLTTNIFFAEQDQCIQRHFNVSELQETTKEWQKKISALQRGIYNKNTDHCCSCPYADPNGQCIITESQGEKQ
ncbi:MAG: UvrD-helicase domain-containing protein [Candidatus Poribacteria bacterium]|nr:UvrD-helicase domain-containing protein [Candidatus Poribacteria bacterium]